MRYNWSWLQVNFLGLCPKSLIHSMTHCRVRIWDTICLRHFLCKASLT